MFDFLQFFYEIRHKPLGFIVLAVFIFIIDRLGRKLITSQVKRLFHVEDKSDFKQIALNQQRIEGKVDLLLQKEGIAWNAPIYETRHQVSATKSAEWSALRLATFTIARGVEKFTNWRMKNMSSINKKILLPLLSAIALFVKQVWGFEISDEQINMYADIVLYLIMFAGIFIKPKKEKANDDFTTPIEPRI